MFTHSQCTWRHVQTRCDVTYLRCDAIIDYERIVPRCSWRNREKFDIDGGSVFVSGLPSNTAREKDPRNQSRADATTHRWTLARLPPATTDVSLLCSSSCDNELHTTTTDPRKPRSRVDLKFIQIIRLSSELHQWKLNSGFTRNHNRYILHTTCILYRWGKTYEVHIAALETRKNMKLC